MSDIARYQAMFDQFNEQGCTSTLYQDAASPLLLPFSERSAADHARYHELQRATLPLGLWDSRIVTRAEPHVFWVMHKSCGYNNGWQYTHTSKIAHWSWYEPYILDLIDHMGRCIRITRLIPSRANEKLIAAWERWQRYRKRKRKMFERIDAAFLKEHTAFAENWVG